MNWIRFTNLLFGARIQINEPDRVQFETNEPYIVARTVNQPCMIPSSMLIMAAHNESICGF